MARFEFNFARVFFGAKPTDILTAVLLLTSVSSRAIKSDVVKITDDLPAVVAEPTNARALLSENSILSELFDIITKLSSESRAYVEEMQGDQPMNFVSSNATRNGKSVDSDGENALHQW